MRVVMFCHSLVSDWNHGNAHFLRGVATELISRGHDVRVYEPRDSWSLSNLLAEHGPRPVEEFRAAYPPLESSAYDLDTLDLDAALADADLVLVHEWNEHELVRRVGLHRARAGRYRLLFHDTHHRAVTAREQMAAYDLAHYDGVLAFGARIRDIYLREGWTGRAWTWHEAADTRVFKPLRPVDSEIADCGLRIADSDSQGATRTNESQETDSLLHSAIRNPQSAIEASAIDHEGDLVWVGNWGDEERTAELHEFLLGPVKELGLKARVYGVRYPPEARAALARAGVEYAGWLPNFRAPEVFARFRVTVHVPRRPYVEKLPGVPTIRPFEALACGIPLVCAPWDDAEHLFTPGRDYLVARDGEEMKRHLRRLLADAGLARELARHGLNTVRARHTCAHRVDELLDIYAELEPTQQGRALTTV